MTELIYQQETIDYKDLSFIIKSLGNIPKLVWLDSSLIQENIGTKSIIGFNPIVEIYGSKKHPEVIDNTNLLEFKKTDFINTFRSIISQIKNNLPFLGYYSYDFFQTNQKQKYIEHLDAYWMLPGTYYEIDHFKKKLLKTLSIKKPLEKFLLHIRNKVTQKHAM
jgi:hypothetical protein